MAKKVNYDGVVLNPPVKNGDKILIIKSNSGLKSVEGKVVTVTSNVKPSKNNFYIRTENGSTHTIYNSGIADEYMLATQTVKLDYAKIKLKQAQAEVAKWEDEVKYREKYPTEEDYVAEKLNKILKAKGTKAIAEVLKTMKETHYL